MKKESRRKHILIGCMTLIKKAYFGKKPHIKNLTQGIHLSIQEALENQIGIQDKTPQLYFTGLTHLKQKDAPSCCPPTMTAALGLVHQCYLSPHTHINLTQTFSQPNWLSESQINKNKQHIYPAFLNALKLLLEVVKPTSVTEVEGKGGVNSRRKT